MTDTFTHLAKRYITDLPRSAIDRWKCEINFKRCVSQIVDVYGIQLPSDNRALWAVFAAEWEKAFADIDASLVVTASEWARAYIKSLPDIRNNNNTDFHFSECYAQIDNPIITEEQFRAVFTAEWNRRINQQAPERIKETAEEYAWSIKRFIVSLNTERILNNKPTERLACMAHLKKDGVDVAAEPWTQELYDATFAAIWGEAVQKAEKEFEEKKEHERRQFRGRLDLMMHHFCDEFYLEEDPAVKFDTFLLEADIPRTNVYETSWRYRLYKDVYLSAWKTRVEEIKAKK